LACLTNQTSPADVPHFAELYPEPGDAWWTASVEWVEEAIPGWTLRCYDPVWPLYGGLYGVPEYVIGSGPSPRGDFLHSILVRSGDGAPVWDPHPSRAGLAGPVVDVVALVRKSWLT
jgi:hypothetical protein